MHRLTALWIAKCGRPQKIVEDPQLITLLARILELCKAKFRYELPCKKTVKKHITLLGLEGKRQSAMICVCACSAQVSS